MKDENTGMLLKNKNAIIYGAGGAIGGAVARAFAREGATVFLAGRTLAKLEAVAQDIAAAGGVAETAEVDALNEHAVNQHADAVAAKAGSIDIALNAVGINHDQGTPFVELDYETFNTPIEGHVKTLFVTSKAVARHMVRQGAGVILTLSTPGAKLSGAGFLGHGVANAAVEAFSRILAGELGASGVRSLCIRPHAIPEAVSAGAHTADVFGAVAERAGITIDQVLESMTGATLLKRLPTLNQVADVAAFLASDRAATMTGTIANLTAGHIVD